MKEELQNRIAELKDSTEDKYVPRDIQDDYRNKLDLLEDFYDAMYD